MISRFCSAGRLYTRSTDALSIARISVEPRIPIAYSYTVTMPGTSSESGTISAGQSKTARLKANSGNYFFITISANSANATYIQFTCSGYSVRVPLTPTMNFRYTTNIIPTGTYQITSDAGTCSPSTRQIGSGNPVTISIN
jgi:hypothetical protein